MNGTINIVRGWKQEFPQAKINTEYNGGVVVSPTEQGDIVIWNDMGDGSIYGMDAFCFPDPSGIVTGSQSVQMNFIDKVAAI